MKKIIFTLIIIPYSIFSQDFNIKGKVSNYNTPLAYASVHVKGKPIGTTTDEEGFYSLKLSKGDYILVCQSIGFTTIEKQVTVNNNQALNFNLKEDVLGLDQIVVTGTKTEKRRTDSPVIVNLINSKTLDNVVATNLSEGLRFQPGLRVETDCQTCNYTQLRMNGLQGGYSQILINGRPIFSPLTGLYGMEQIPVNMIERIEVVRGGVSALYGSNAIGGTVNVITKIPIKNEYNLTYTYQSINNNASDNILLGNATVVNDDRSAGATFFINKRDRNTYDDNGDNYSELPSLKNNSFGANLFYLPSENEKIEASISSIYEYRYGGEQVNKAAHLAKQSEERTHNIIMGSLDYQINFNEDKNSFIAYYGGQITDRDHYTGILPDDENELNSFLVNPPYGTSKVETHQAGVQLNHKVDSFVGGEAIFTFGTEYVYDDVLDVIEAYNYKIDQTTRNWGAFLQSDWDITPKINFLSGLRIDKHNLLDKVIASPRLSFLYKMNKESQFRLGWGTGFRAPQAFDTDLHIAFAGGGISRISLSDNLFEERSNSYTASFNYDKATEHLIAGFTVESFYTKLNDAFYLFPLGEDNFGELFEKRNGDGAVVKGITVETRANFDYVLQVDAGFTLQSSKFTEAVENIEGLPTKKEFLRTPNTYGFATLTYTPTKRFNASANLVYTGSMDIAHFGGENTGQAIDEYKDTPSFLETSLRLGYTFNSNKLNTGLEVFGGVKNITNAYQNDFDIGKNRDSNYVYGPSLPRTIFLGLRLKSL
ncbi:TonB-dependent receptor [Cellulophaga lytica]|uniref:TonB-dependent receptor n=1 Tax=Cellulophaga lytica (strain ATCC 23178 / DSM 7489 / JCM 8516 / NBRC 14961 / NCIMB 1423 / VKM B-1433 / Cy l20) TaxID=867900 RepID=F0RAV3_CELLC|nr:TonB-dependent receptor [Cellulophaga lytica]ADY29509.1 TonB-dependent receptor [Cellulophaga lytica DSM 7489]WQG76317.1 TonB-dependent receptor [Cellulophaga lytica]